MSGDGSDPANAPSRRLHESIFAAIYSRAGSSIVDIPTVLERVDSVERWLLTFEELDGGLRRLSSAGRIAEVDVSRYVSVGSRHPTHPYSGTSREGYEAAVTAYRADDRRRAMVLRFPDGDEVVAPGWPGTPAAARIHP